MPASPCSISILTLPTSVTSGDDETPPTVRFTNVEEFLQAIDHISEDFVIVTDVSPDNFTLLDNELEARGRNIRLRRYHADSQILFITIPNHIHEQLHIILYQEFASMVDRMGLRRSWKSIAAATYQARGRGGSGGGGGQADSSGGPIPERQYAWPTLVIEAGYSESLQYLRDDMKWWFSESNHDVKIVILAKFDYRQQEIILEKWEEEPWEEEPRGARPGATTARSVGLFAPVQQQTITITKNPTNPVSYNVARGSLVLSFRLLFLRNPGPGEGDIVFSIPDLEWYAERVWAEVEGQ
ncbi:hypothetical protein AAE478_000719 [Parahypoxylon ruwenzoriense]